MSDPYLPQPKGFRDLVPWADPYIASLLEKLSHTAAREGLYAERPDSEPRAEWSPRNWPRRSW